MMIFIRQKLTFLGRYITCFSPLVWPTSYRIFCCCEKSDWIFFPPTSTKPLDNLVFSSHRSKDEEILFSLCGRISPASSPLFFFPLRFPMCGVFDKRTDRFSPPSMHCTFSDSFAPPSEVLVGVLSITRTFSFPMVILWRRTTPEFWIGHGSLSFGRSFPLFPSPEVPPYDILSPLGVKRRHAFTIHRVLSCRRSVFSIRNDSRRLFHSLFFVQLWVPFSSFLYVSKSTVIPPPPGRWTSFSSFHYVQFFNVRSSPSGGRPLELHKTHSSRSSCLLSFLPFTRYGCCPHPSFRKCGMKSPNSITW